jgi:aspartate/methionine/tyrosine aminotransferase
VRAETGSYQDEPVIPGLASVLAASWPSRAEAIVVVDGALDAISRTLDQVVRFGDRVVVEHPGFPPFLDLLDAFGAEAVPVRLDEHGMLPEALRAALARRPAALLLQPRAQNPTGASMTVGRAEELARVIRSSDDADALVVIEDDHSGLISTEGDVTLGAWLPDRVVHVRSFSKSHGPDLRIAALGGRGGSSSASWRAACSGPAGRRACSRRSCSTCSPTAHRSTPWPRRGASTTRGSARSATRCASAGSPSHPPTASTCGCPC